jgi:hypothetical protein
MIWGGEEAVAQIRALPFPPWARLALFGPRISVAALDGACWDDEAERASWCQRIARDLWQFDQQACSSPQTLFLERRDGCDVDAFVRTLSVALANESRAHPRREIQPAQTSAICLARAAWLLEDREQVRSAVFPATPDWTLLVGTGADIPRPTWAARSPCCWSMISLSRSPGSTARCRRSGSGSKTPRAKLRWQRSQAAMAWTGS